jgi:lysozyme
MPSRHRRPAPVGIGLAATAVLAATIAVTFVPPPGPRAGPPARTVPGIDVSHYQGPIQWRRVRADGYRFAYVKATEGRGLVDHTYAGNARAAAAAGLTVGAYHYARPDRRPGDAIAEADFFLRVARPRAGQLVPLLDLEHSGGLGPPALRTWVRTWLDRVRAAVGARPAIYASSRFWHVQMGGTTDFVSYPLMWTTRTPGRIAPARGWAPMGWSIVQWSLCGHVTGIGGCVDLDAMRVDRVRLLRIG